MVISGYLHWKLHTCLEVSCFGSVFSTEVPMCIKFHEDKSGVDCAGKINISRAMKHIEMYSTCSYHT